MFQLLDITLINTYDDKSKTYHNWMKSTCLVEVFKHSTWMELPQAKPSNIVLEWDYLKKSFATPIYMTYGKSHLMVVFTNQTYKNDIPQNQPRRVIY